MSIKDVRTVLFCKPFLRLRCWIILPLKSQIAIPSNTEFKTIKLFLIVTPPNELFFLTKLLASVFHDFTVLFSYINSPFSSVIIKILFLSSAYIAQISVLLKLVVFGKEYSLPFLYSKIPFPSS
ncbi:hypothetical protein D3C87_1429400 [compost metagenome]